MVGFRLYSSTRPNFGCLDVYHVNISVRRNHVLKVGGIEMDTLVSV